MSLQEILYEALCKLEELPKTPDVIRAIRAICYQLEQGGN